MCPTCGHTVQRVNEGVSPVTFWCPRCGTLKMERSVPEHEAPSFYRIILLNLASSRLVASVERMALWAKVAHVFGLGSTSARNFCEALKFNPNEGEK